MHDLVALPEQTNAASFLAQYAQQARMPAKHTCMAESLKLP
jgi:hypothetical protein